MSAALTSLHFSEPFTHGPHPNMVLTRFFTAKENTSCEFVRLTKSLIANAEPFSYGSRDGSITSSDMRGTCSNSAPDAKKRTPQNSCKKS